MSDAAAEEKNKMVEKQRTVQKEKKKQKYDVGAL